VSDAVELVCSNRQRAATRTSGMGNQWWSREVYHFRSGNRTMCGRDCSEWLVIGPGTLEAAAKDRNCCARCLAKAGA
jgi:hypothetical protein